MLKRNDHPGGHPDSEAISDFRSSPRRGGDFEAPRTFDLQLHKMSKMCSLYWPRGAAPPASADHDFIISTHIFASVRTGALPRLFPGIPAARTKHNGPIRGYFPGLRRPGKKTRNSLQEFITHWLVCASGFSRPTPGDPFVNHVGYALGANTIGDLGGRKSGPEVPWRGRLNIGRNRPPKARVLTKSDAASTFDALDPSLSTKWCSSSIDVR